MALRLLKDTAVGVSHGGENATTFPKLRTDCPSFVVGDIHGRLDLLDRLLDEIDEFVGATGVHDPHLVFIGNYIGFGSDSLGVLEKLRSLTSVLPGHFLCLRGRQEKLLLEFLERPKLLGPNWLQNGGLQVLESFGICGSDSNGDAHHLEDIGQELRLALNTRWHEVLDWLVALPSCWVSGNMLVIGAGANPHNYSVFGSKTTKQAEPVWIASGQKICDAVTIGQGRISLDTNAVQTGRLSAFVAIPGHAPVALQT